MSLPDNIRIAALDGDLHDLARFLDEQPQHVNSIVVDSSFEISHMTFLEYSVTTCREEDMVPVVQLLLARGARVNSDRADSVPALHRALHLGTSSPYIIPLVRLLLAAGANVDRLHNDFTPLGLMIALMGQSLDGTEWEPRRDIFVALLRAGASLESAETQLIFDNGTSATAVSFLDEVRRTDPSLRNNEEFFEVRALLAGVREDGSWKSYARRPHRSILRLRSLYARGRATLARAQRRKPRGLDARRDRAITFLVKLGDNGVLWNVLSFWRATD